MIAALFVIFIPQWISGNYTQEIIIWNTGQGQWVTAIDNKHCIHFDSGGEFYNKNNLKKCSQKINVLYLSHWDWDHIRYASQLQKIFQNLCLNSYPRGISSKFKTQMIKKIPLCKLSSKNIFELSLPPISKSKLQSNDLSSVIIYDKKLLIPGDSTSKMEKLWSHHLYSFQNLKWIIAGHHGSKTSSSDYLIHRMPSVYQSIISARKQVYGHPHKIILERFRKNGIAPIRTEDWGNIHIRTRPINN